MSRLFFKRNSRPTVINISTWLLWISLSVCYRIWLSSPISDYLPLRLVVCHSLPWAAERETISGRSWELPPTLVLHNSNKHSHAFWKLWTMFLHRLSLWNHCDWSVTLFTYIIKSPLIPLLVMSLLFVPNVCSAVEKVTAICLTAIYHCLSMISN